MFAILMDHFGPLLLGAFYAEGVYGWRGKRLWAELGILPLYWPMCWVGWWLGLICVRSVQFYCHPY